MELKINLYKTAPKWWDLEIEKNGGHFCSSSSWARFNELLGIGCGFYLEVSDGEERLMLVLVYETILGGNYLVNFPKAVLRVIRRLGIFSTFSMHLQPVVCSDKAYQKEVSVTVLRYLMDLANKEGKNFMPADFLLFDNLEKAKEICEKDMELAATTRVTLEKGMYDSLDESVKSGIRKCKNLGVEVCENADLDEFYEGLLLGWGKNKLAVVPKKYYTILAENFYENIKFYTASHEGKLLGGSGIMTFGHNMMEFSMFVTPYAQEAKIPAGDLIKWTIIEDGIKRGFKELDLNMISVDASASNKIKNINFYKLKWGGKIVYGVKMLKLRPMLKFVRRVKQRFLGI